MANVVFISKHIEDICKKRDKNKQFVIRHTLIKALFCKNVLLGFMRMRGANGHCNKTFLGCQGKGGYCLFGCYDSGGHMSVISQWPFVKNIITPIAALKRGLGHAENVRKNCLIYVAYV